MAQLTSSELLASDALCYTALGNTNSDKRVNPTEPSTSRKKLYHMLIFCGLIFLLIATSIGRNGLLTRSSLYFSRSRLSCEYPPTRREWRSLSTKEKQDYIKAVQCLKTMPSLIGMDQSLYNDFPWVHMMIGDYCARSEFYYHEFLLIFDSSWRRRFPELTSLLSACI